MHGCCYNLPSDIGFYPQLAKVVEPIVIEHVLPVKLVDPFHDAVMHRFEALCEP